MDALHNVIVSVKVAFHQINKVFVNVLFFHHLTKWLAGKMKWVCEPHLACRP